MSSLINTLVSQLGIDEAQAKGGAGLLFKLAQEKLGGDFSQLAAAIPEARGLIDSAPKASGMAQLAGGLLGALGGKNAEGLGDLAELASGFSQLKLDSHLIAKFIPIVLEFVKGQGGEQLMAILAKAIKQ